MFFMNTYEIDEAVRAFALDPVLGPAARTLSNLRDAANANSDGWAYWPKPCRAARALQVLLHDATMRRIRWTETPEPTAEDVRKALRPVKAFRTRSGIAFDIESP